ncbi:MAG: choice-of-anchor D domain-containing protein, partial [Myxococcaceae bacterium]
MTRSFRPVLLTVFALAALAGCDCGKRSNVDRRLAEIGVVWTDQGLEVTNRDATYDFGDAFMGDSVGRKLVIKNLGSGPLTLELLERVEGDPVTIGDAVAPDAAFDVRFTQGQTIGAADEANLDMFFTPPQAKDSTLTQEPHWAKLLLHGGNTAPEEETASILLKGNGVQGSCLLPNKLDFGKVPTGETFELSYEVKNTAPVIAAGFVGEPYSSTGDHNAFGHAPGSPIGAFTTPAGGTTRVTFTFSPTDLHVYEAQVKLRASAQCPEGLVTLTGEGVDQILTWTPATLDFGYVSPGVTSTREILFTNIGRIPVNLTNVRTGSPNDFGVVAGAGGDPTKFTVPGGGVPTPMTVVCRPSSLGPKDSVLNFNTGLVKPPQGAPALKCYGGGPHITVIPRPTLAFGKVGYFANANPAPSVVRKVRVMNTGTRPPTPDPSLNLRLGQVTPAGPGQMPLLALQPTGTTVAGEFSVALGPYSPGVGLEAVAGRNFVDITVTLTPQSVGPKTATLTIFSNDSNEPAVEIEISADAQLLPPCNLSVAPAALNFGLITPPTFKDLPVKVTNLGANAGDICYLSGIEIASGGDPAFTMPNGPIASKELQPGESFDIVVRVWPQGAVPTGVSTLHAFLTFNASRPVNPQVTVPLAASIGPVCLTVAPDTLDFGTVKKGCNSAIRTFTMYNVCTTTVVLQSFVMQAAAGQPAGGPD